jgi:hypothetical protein
VFRTVRATRYVTPLREGGSLPAIIEADDQRLYVLKFRGAGQGVKALVAELIAATLAKELSLNVPEPVLVELDGTLGRNERDSEIRELLLQSGGLNVGFEYLAGALTYEPLAGPPLEVQLASDIVWFDALVMNVDRTVKNPNLLWWRGALWLIDHGASLYFQHDWGSALERAASLFSQVKHHVLLPLAGGLDAAHARLSSRLPGEAFERAVASVPAEWLGAHRADYLQCLAARAAAAPAFVEEAKRARAALL